MKSQLLDFLFTKNVLVNDKKSDNAFAALFALAKKFGIRIVSGAEYAHEDLIPYVADMLGENVPAPFYRNFPESVKSLSKNALLFDQLFHYAITYGLGDFSEAGHSLFEKDFERLAFNEQTEIRKFGIVSESEAVEMLKTFVEDLLKGTRPLSETSFRVVKTYIEDYGYRVENCACKDTAIRLLFETEEEYYAKFLWLSDVIKFVELLNYINYGEKDIKKLNLCNSDRKLITKVLDLIFAGGYCNTKECFEKKALWCGLLHHIHYKPKTPVAEEFITLMRGKGNQSVYSAFERAMLDSDIKRAATCLREGKGAGALLRHLNYLLSRCRTKEDIDFIINSLDTDNAIILIQLLIQYADYTPDSARAFKFPRFNKLRVHYETPEEQARRRSIIDEETVEALYKTMEASLKRILSGRLGKVYVAPEMYKIAVPLQEGTSNGGYGVLPKGSRLPIGECKKLRAFTYWEKVNDIDLSVIGITEDGVQEEFSWRTMYYNQTEELTFSGDQTSGYSGGSEYFDVDVPLFKKNHPEIKYLVFCDNVYSYSTFDQCLCKAGYMIRDKVDSGEVFEPKTVKSSFIINCASTSAYLFGIDLEKSEFVWLNIANDSYSAIAGNAEVGFLTHYFKMTSIINLGKLFEMLATKVVDNPKDADVVLSDEDVEVKDGAQVIRSYNFERIMALIN